MVVVNWRNRSEEELVTQACLGNLNAFDALVHRYRPGALVLARQIAGPKDVAEDVVQDAFLAAFKALPQLEDVDRFAAWFGAIVRHRARKQTHARREVTLPLDAVICSHAPSLTEAIEKRAEAGVMRHALARLPEEIRTVMDLYYIEEWRVTQIAQFLALPNTTVKWRLNVGRNKLRTSLENYQEYFNGTGK